MKKLSVAVILLSAFATATVQAQEKVLQPSSITPMPKITKAAWNNLGEIIDESEPSAIEAKYGDTVIAELYFDGIDVH